VGPQLSELELSDSDSSVDSILGVCLDGFDGDAWMSEAEGAQDDIQVGAAAEVNDPGDILWRTTAWRAGAKDNVAKRAGESREQPSSALSGKRVTFDQQGLVIGEQDAAGGGMEVGVSVIAGSAAGQGIPLTPDEKKAKKRLQGKKNRSPSYKKKTTRAGGSSDNRARSARYESTLSNDDDCFYYCKK